MNNKDSKTALRKIGKIAAVVLYIAVLAALLIGATTAQYRETKSFFSDFDIASFNTAILGASASDTRSTALTKLQDGSIKVFAESFDSDNFLPGTTNRKLPFTITNGTKDTGFSEAPVQYCIKLRVTKNLPLTFTLTCTTTDAGGTATTKTYYPSKAANVIEPTITGDAKWYEYSFYSKQNYTDSDEEAVFNLGYGQADLNMHSLNISWPSNSSNNDTKYMKEVEMIEVLVETSSANLTPTAGRTTELTSGLVPTIPEDTYKPVGLLYTIDTSNGYEYSITLNQKETVYSYSYDIDYRAFTKAGNSAPYAFSMVLDDGISYQKSPSEDVQLLYPAYSHYTLRMRVPVAALNYKPSTATSDFSNEGYTYRIDLNDKPNIGKTTTLLRIPTQSRYYLYRVNEGYPDVVGNGEWLQTVTTDKEAIEYWNALSSTEQLESYIYRQDLYHIQGYTYENITTNTIKQIDALTHKVNAIVGYSDEIKISIFAGDGSNADISNISDGGTFEKFSVDHKLYLDVDIVYSDKSTTDKLPLALKD